mmetsp:Transcript_34855/g.46995  ORF Transcript_34855/g.46995 Transcript_34855/m.46995 type:complete len:146 (+) Transcript_34855:458-895(+)
MSYIAASILLHTGDELQAFRCLGNLMNKELVFTFYSFEMNKVNIVFHVFMKLMHDRLPKLYQVFTDAGIQCNVFLFEWVVALFTNIFHLEMSARIWDSYLHYGDYYLMKVFLAICVCLERQINMEDSFEMLVVMFKTVDKHVTED